MSSPSGSAVNIAIVSLFPEMFAAITESGISRRAVEQGLVKLSFFNPRTYTTDKHQTVDDRPYGGGPGMVMRVEPLAKALLAAKHWHSERREETALTGAQRETVIYMSPQGGQLNNEAVDIMAAAGDFTIIAGRYEGVDQRFIDAFVDQEWSIGDYVLSGGELPAMVLIDALIRKLPGALGDAQSAEQDSFENGLLDCPHYTRPETLAEQWQEGDENRNVPSVLLSGDHKKIELWRLKQSLGRTWERRPDLLEKLDLDQSQRNLLTEYQQQKLSCSSSDD